MDFMDSTGQYDDQGTKLYGRYDLDEGFFYAVGMQKEGFNKEPFYGFNLKKFERWCLRKLKSEGNGVA